MDGGGGEDRCVCCSADIYYNCEHFQINLYLNMLFVTTEQMHRETVLTLRILNMNGLWWLTTQVCRRYKLNAALYGILISQIKLIQFIHYLEGSMYPPCSTSDDSSTAWIAAGKSHFSPKTSIPSVNQLKLMIWNRRKRRPKVTL